MCIRDSINADNTELGILEISSGGLAGNNLFIILNTYATALVIGLISACTFLILQYFIFYDFIKAIYSFFTNEKSVPKKQNKPKNIVKEVDKTLIDEPRLIYKCFIYFFYDIFWFILFFWNRFFVCKKRINSFYKIIKNKVLKY